MDNAAKPKTTSFFPLWKLKGNQLIPKMATMYLAHLEEENTKGDKEVEREDPRTALMELQKSLWYASQGL